MKTAGLLAGVALAVAGMGVAQAQTAACNQMKLMLTAKVEAIRELRGEETKRDNNYVYHSSKTNLSGFNGCEAKNPPKQDPDEYEEYTVSCTNEFANSEAATDYLEDMFACVKDMVPERKATERFMEGAYRIVEMDATSWYGGRNITFDFGETEFVRLWVRKSYATSEEVHVNLFYYFKP